MALFERFNRSMVVTILRVKGESCMQKMTMDELVQFMNENDNEFVIRVEIEDKEDKDGEKAGCGVD